MTRSLPRGAPLAEHGAALPHHRLSEPAAHLANQRHIAHGTRVVSTASRLSEPAREGTLAFADRRIAHSTGAVSTASRLSEPAREGTLAFADRRIAHGTGVVSTVSRLSEPAREGDLAFADRRIAHGTGVVSTASRLSEPAREGSLANQGIAHGVVSTVSRLSEPAREGSLANQRHIAHGTGVVSTVSRLSGPARERSLANQRIAHGTGAASAFPLGVLLTTFLLSACVTAQGAAARLTPREEAQVLLARGDGAKALALLTELQAKAPNDLNLARMVAEANVKAGTADAFLATIATKDTALSHYQQGLVRFARANDAGGPAITNFRRAVELAPEEPEFRYRLGVALLESEQYDAARTELEAATKQAGDRTGWFLPLAKARYRTSDDKGAIEAIRVVVMGAPTPAEVKTARALMDQLADPFAGLPRSARPALEEAIQWLEVADVPQQAIERLEELLRDYPDQPAVHALLGMSWARLDDAGRAVEELKRAIELAPSDGKNHLYLAQLYEARQRPKNAEEHWLKAIERNPLLDQAWLKLGGVALERQDLVGARRDFEIATHLLPGDPAAHGKLALVHQLEQNWPAADRELHAVLDKDPENLEFVLRLGVLHTERFTRAKSAAERDAAAAEARKWLTKILDAQPENAIASRALERIKK